MKTRQIKILNKASAIKQVLVIVKGLMDNNLNFTLINKRDETEFCITSVKHCDSVLKHFPVFILKYDTFGKRYAELIIRYE